MCLDQESPIALVCAMPAIRFATFWCTGQCSSLLNQLATAGGRTLEGSDVPNFNQKLTILIREFTLEKGLTSTVNMGDILPKILTHLCTWEFTLVEVLRYIWNVHFPYLVLTTLEETLIRENHDCYRITGLLGIGGDCSQLVECAFSECASRSDTVKKTAESLRTQVWWSPAMLIFSVAKVTVS